jgi:hypothetical protein
MICCRTRWRWSSEPGIWSTSPFRASVATIPLRRRAVVRQLMGYFQVCRRMRLSTYWRPPKYPAASMTITIRISTDAGKVLRVPI